jgi:hypothetical protein
MGSARVRVRAMGLCALLSLGACSLINHFDDVKPGTTGGAGGSTGVGTTTTGTSTSTGGSSTTGTGGATTAATGGGSNTGGAATTGTTGGTGGAGTGGSAVDSGVGDVKTEMAPPRVLQCRFLIGSAMGGHRKLDDYSTIMGMDRTLTDKLFMLPVSNGTSVRILTQLRGTQNNYLQYFASDGGSSGMMGQPIYAGGRLMEARKMDMNSSGALVLNQDMHPPQFMLHRFDDANQNPMPAVNPLTNPGDIGTSGQVEGSFAPAPDGTIALTMSFPSMTGNFFTAAFGLYTGTPVTIVPLFNDPNPDVARPTNVLRVRPASMNYAFFGQSPEVEYQIPDSAGTLMQTQHRTVPGNLFVLMSGIDMMGKLNLVAADLGTAMMPSLKLYVGQTDPLQAFMFDTSAFVLAKSAASLADVPVGGSMSGLTDDMLLFAGPTGISRKELSVWFVDIWGATRVEQKLADTMGEVSNAVAFPRGVIGSANNKWHIAWSETLLDGMGNKYDVLWYDQIECL